MSSQEVILSEYPILALGMSKPKHSEENDKSLPHLSSHSKSYAQTIMFQNNKYLQITKCGSKQYVLSITFSSFSQTIIYSFFFFLFKGETFIKKPNQQ